MPRHAQKILSDDHFVWASSVYDTDHLTMCLIIKGLDREGKSPYPLNPARRTFNNVLSEGSPRSLGTNRR
jgi:hypothetical protein